MPRLAAVGVEVDVTEIVAVDQDSPLVRVDEPADESRDGCLPGARLPDQREAAAGRDGEIERVDDRSRGVGERDVLEGDRACDRGQDGRAVPARDLRNLIENGTDLLGRSGRRLELAVQLAQLRERVEEQGGQADERDDRSRTGATICGEPRPDKQHDAGSERALDVEDREEQRRQPLGSQVESPLGQIEIVERVLESGLAAGRLDDRHARDRLGDVRR